MQGLHLTGDLFGCGCSVATLTDLNALSTLCRKATLDAKLTIVDEKWHVFPEWNGQPGGITGTILLAESHLAIHTWPESRGVTLDVYVCNFTEDNTGKAEQLFDTLMMAFRPQKQVVNRITRGDISGGDEDSDAGGGAARTAASEALGSREVSTVVAPSGSTDLQSPQAQLSFDWLNAHAGYGFTVREKLAEIESAYQRVEVYDTHQFGRLFRLDGRLMTSEGDEFFYHESMTHPAALAHPNPESVLVIGGGDGGSSEELFKHPSIQRIVMAELDPVVIDISRQYLGSIHKGSLDDPRLDIRIGDGFEYVRTTNERFDLIVLDLTDPDTPAFHLYSEEFFRMCQRALKPGGLLTLHLGSPVYQEETVRKNAAALRRVFKHVAPLSLFIPLYGSQWCLAVASDTIDPRTTSVETIAQRMVERKLDGLRFYHPALHPALFTLPRFVQDMVGQPPGAGVARTAHLRVA